MITHAHYTHLHLHLYFELATDVFSRRVRMYAQLMRDASSTPTQPHECSLARVCGGSASLTASMHMHGLSVQMQQGPWKSCFIRHGYDPREDPHARAFQLVTLALRKKNSGENNDVVSVGCECWGTVPARQITVQLCDVPDPAVQVSGAILLLH